MSRRLRQVTEPFVVAPPNWARVRTRLRTDDNDVAVLRAVGSHLGSLAGVDLAKRSALERRSLLSRIHGIDRRCSIPVGGRQGKVRGYPSRHEIFEKRRRLQVLKHRLADLERRITAGRVGVCRGGGRLAKSRRHLDAAGLSETQWRERWAAERLFITADDEAGQLLGNLTIRWHPFEQWLDLRLPKPLEHLANRSAGRYRLSCAVEFCYRGDEVAAQASSGAVRYDISFNAGSGRWYCDASWRLAINDQRLSLDGLRAHPVLAVDLNHGHLACWVVDAFGNPVGAAFTVAVDLAGLSASRCDGRLRQAISELCAVATASKCGAIVIENLDFADSRAEGRERTGTRPSQGKRGRSFRRLVAGLPTAKFRDRLCQMATNKGLAVIAVDPAYTSRWGADHWLGPLQQISLKRAATTRRHSSSADVGSGTEHGDGKGVT